jgi:uncharacterized spore protein YtfJ
MKVEHLDDMMRLVGEELATFANSNVVVGTPIEFSNATVVTISRVSIGLAGGGAGGEGEGKVKTASKDSALEGAGGASTGAARVRPIAVVVFTEDDVAVLPIPEKTNRRDKWLEMIPDIVQKVSNITFRKRETDEE